MPPKATAFSTATATATTTTARRLLIFSILFLSILLLMIFSTTEPCLNDFLLLQNPHQTLITSIHTTTTIPSNTYPTWFEPISKPFKGPAGKQPNIGLVNMEGETLEGLENLDAHVTHVQFDRVSPNVSWIDVYPLWIDEDEKHMIPTCPDIPMPRDMENYSGLDVVVAKVPCGNWSEGQRVGIRDVFRLQVTLVAAKLAAESGSKEVSVVLFTGGGCEPMWELFRCDDLVWRGGRYWVYKPDVLRLKQKLSLPVGACKVAAQPYFELGNQRQEESMATRSNTVVTPSSPTEAYVTVLHSSELYVCGAIALAQSILQTNTTKDLILLADGNISPKSIQGLRSAGWKIKRIERVRCPTAKKGHYNEWNCSKLRIWQLTQYTKLIFIDADFIVLKNIDHFFSYPQLSAAEDTMSIFNSGVMVVEPSNCFFDALMIKRYKLDSYNGGDQGLLNEVFTWWHRLPKKVGFLKCFMEEKGPRELPDDVYMIHFVGVKPWACYRDYDCNWDQVDRRIFASDDVHRRWWQVYDGMPESLQPYCGLTNYMDANIRMWREKSKSDSRFIDSHWKIDVKDPRKFNLN